MNTNSGTNFHLGIDPRSRKVIVLGKTTNAEPLAAISLRAEGWHVRDLGGTVPVLLRGKEVRGWQVIPSGAKISLGESSWQPPRSPLTESQGLAIRLDNVTKVVSSGGHLSPKKSKAILSNVSLEIQPGQFVGILGPSGAGKSTLLRVMNGDHSVTSGRITLNGLPLREFLLEYGPRLAYLPQDPILHEGLSPRDALTYLARLQQVPVEKVISSLAQVGLVEVGHPSDKTLKVDTPIAELSGGERKRVALAAALLADPIGLFLDEATSGLDPGLEEEMMELFRSIADTGKTVICITHFPAHVAKCDRLIVVSHGGLPFCGTPDELVRYYRHQARKYGLAEVNRIDDIYHVLHHGTPDPRDRFASPNVGPRAEGDRAESMTQMVRRRKRAMSLAPNIGSQWGILMMRYVRLLARDGTNLALLLLQAPVIALLIGATFGNIAVDYTERHAADWKQVAFLLVMSVIWCSGTNGVREVVKERPIFLHESRFGINAHAYLLSKFIPLGIISIVQGWLLLLVLGAITSFAGNWFVHGVTIAVLALAGTALGLTISSCVRTSERAMTWLPVILIAQAVLSGGLARLGGSVKWIAQLMASAYWGLNGLKDTLSTAMQDATFVSAEGEYQPPILGRGPHYLWDLLALLIQVVALLWLGAFVLRRAKRHLR